MDENIRLPSRTSPKKSESKAMSYYSRSGRTEIPVKDRNVLPVSLDPDAMQKLLEELMLRENEERLEVEGDARLPQQVPGLQLQ